MTKSLLVLRYFSLLSFSVALPNCCFNLTEYATLLLAFPCNFTCSLNQKPFEGNCVSCAFIKHQTENTFTGSESTNLLEPVITCQDIFYKKNSTKQNLWGQAVLTWPVQNVIKPSLFLIEVKEAPVGKWHFVGMTNRTLALVEDLNYSSEYMFRITPLVTPNLILPLYVSDWIFLTVGNTMKSLNLNATDFRFEKKSVQVAIEWTIPKEAPCSFLLCWWQTDYLAGTESQKIINMFVHSSPIVITSLLFQTNYSVKLDPLYLSDVQKVSGEEIWFVTPSCLTLTRGNFSLCAPGPPLNVTVSWIDDGKISVTWLPPEYASSNNQVSGYHVSVREASEVYQTVLRYKESFTVGKNIHAALISDLSSSVLHIFEVRATSSGGISPSVIVELDIKEPRASFQPSSHVPWYYIIPSSVIAVIAILCAVCLTFFRMQRRPRNGIPSGTADIPDHLLPHLLSSKKIDLHDVIGKGEFGVVHRGVYCRNKNKEVVAVKIFPAESLSRSKLLHEVSILHMVGRHNNIVGLIGFTLDFDKISLVLEYCALGNLHTRIRKLKRELSVKKKQISDPKQPLMEANKVKDKHYGILVSSYIHQIAVGMEYVSSLKLIHRDLAARNILLCSENHVKIGDFGLAKDVSEDLTYSVTKQKKLPIRWMAPESLEKHIFTTHSDVWSFGVLMWEIFKFGKVPYTTLSNSAVLLYLKSGYRLPKPNASSQQWYHLMLECWHRNPNKRPTFKELTMKTEDILSKLSQYTVVVND